MLLDSAHSIGEFVAESKEEIFAAVEASHVMRAEGDSVGCGIHFR